jgi:hypothetical protein
MNEREGVVEEERAGKGEEGQGIEGGEMGGERDLDQVSV